MNDDKKDQQTDAGVVEQERARTEALEYGQDHIVDDEPVKGGEGAVPPAPMP